MSERLRALIEQWRREASESLEKWPRGAILPAKKLRQCADELTAVLTEADTKDAENASKSAESERK